MSVDFRLMTDNWFFNEDVSISASSENPNFPASNMADPFRSSVWRSSGTFEIRTGSNDALDFDEGGAELNATLTQGDYTPDTLATEIDTQLTATGAGSYTVTYSTITQAFTIVKSTGTFNILWNTGTNTATCVADTIGFSTAADSAGALTYSGAARIHTSERLILDIQTAEDFDTFVLLFPKSDGIKFSNSVTLRLQANATANFDSPAVDVDVTSLLDEDYEVLVYKWSAAISYRYFALKIIDKANSNGYVEVGQIFLSNSTTINRALDNAFTLGLTDLSTSRFTPTGHKHTDIYPKRKNLSFNWSVIPYTDAQTIEKIFNRHGTHERICVLLDYDEDLFQKEDTFIYGSFGAVFNMQHVFMDRISLPLEITEEF